MIGFPLENDYKLHPSGSGEIDAKGGSPPELIKSRPLEASDINGLREGTTRAFLLSWLVWDEIGRNEERIGVGIQPLAYV